MKKLLPSFIKVFIIVCVIASTVGKAYCQEDTIPRIYAKSVFFPYPMEKHWKSSLGFVLTTLPQDITEEQHYRVPAIDFHVLKKVSKRLYLDGRINAQVLQNMVSLGPHWATPITKKLSVAIGNDVAWWFGFITTEGFKTRGSGWLNTPNLSLGYQFNNKILLTIKGEALMNVSFNAYTGETPVAANYRLFSGSAFSIILEQPFYNHHSLTLGFKVVYTDFFWQTWALFETFQRNIYYPQVIVGLIL
jgi:hypothetical protein